MAKIMVMLEVDEEKVKKVSRNNDLENAITRELDWLRDSGMVVESWQFAEREKVNKVINMEKLAKYLEDESIIEFDSAEECMKYFNTYDFKSFKSVEEMKEFQGEYGFGVGEKWYHVDYDIALDVWEKDKVAMSEVDRLRTGLQGENDEKKHDDLEEAKDNPVVEYNGYSIFEKDEAFTVGSVSNEGFEDCTLENLGVGDEHEMAKWCMEHGNSVIFEDLRSVNKNLSYDDYLKHLDRYERENGDCIDEEFIVPCVRFVSVEKAKEFLDWVEKRYLEKDIKKQASLDEKMVAAKGQTDKGVKLFVEDEICKVFIDNVSYGDKKLLSIVQCGEKYINYYNEEQLVRGYGLVGPFDSLEKAEEMLKKHRPCAVECKDVDKIKKLFYGKDKKQVLSGINKFLNKELGKGDHRVQR